MKCAIVVAADEANGIGIGGYLPWKIPSEAAWFRKLTTSGHTNAVIMGVNTWTKLIRPLSGRFNIVVSTKLSHSAYPALSFIARSLQEALDHCRRINITNTWIIGGTRLYQEAMLSEECNSIILSRINGIHECDTWFPPIPDTFTQLEESDHENKGKIWSIETYSR